MERLCSNTLDDFKKALEQDLESGKEFSLASNSCTEFFMSRFDEGCAGIFRNQEINNESAH